MEIRAVELRDCQRIFEFICELEETTFDYQSFQQIYNFNLAKEHTIYLVAVDETGIVIGYVSCHGQFLLHHMSMVFEIQELFVVKEYRNKKIGQALVKRLEQTLLSHGHRLLEVTTNTKRISTQRFYSNFGFAQTHVKFTKEM
jgi:(aminoalkyl)phosphonate N-acetyltransferase